jgi:hypothetical protein
LINDLGFEKPQLMADGNTKNIAALMSISTDKTKKLYND